MNQFELNTSVNKVNIFLLNFSEIEGRLDPSFNYHLKNSNFRSVFQEESLYKISKPFSGGTPSKEKPEYWNGDIPWVSPKDFKGLYLYSSKDFISEAGLKNSSTKLVPENAVLIVVRSGILIHTLPVTINKIPVTINQDIKAFVINDSRILPEFLGTYFFVFGQKLLPLITKHSTTVQSINTEQFAKLKIPVPSKEVQQQVIDIINGGIRVRQQKEQESQALLDSIDDYLLGELGITLPEQDNRIENRIFQTQFKQLQSRIDPFFYKKEFREIETNISKCPWKVVALEEIFQINRGGSPRPINDYFTDAEDGINWIKIGDTKNDDKYIYSTKQKIKPEGAKYSRKVSEGDFILSNSMSFGRPYIMKISGYIHDGWLLFKPKVANIDKDYLHSILGSSLIYRLFEKSTIGGVVDNLNIDLVKKVKIPLPPLKKQTEIAKHIAKTRNRAKQLQQQAKSELEQAKQEVEQLILGC